MRYETNVVTGEVTEHADAPATPEPPPTPLERLNKLDHDFALTQRNLREFMLLTVEALKGVPVDLSVLPGVQVVAAVEAEAATLRAQL